MDWYSEEGTGWCGESFEMIAVGKKCEYCVTIGSVRRSGNSGREKVGQCGRHVTNNNDAVLMTS